MPRRHADPPQTPPPAPEQTTGKGRPTPKRKEAEARRRQPLGAPVDRRSARAQARDQRLASRRALMEGDESRMPVRDRGPVRRFARDYVDSRRTAAEFFLPVGVALYIPLILVHNNVVGTAVSLALGLLLLLLVLDLVRVGLGLRRALHLRFPDEDTRGATLYGVTRVGQIRRWRLPRPKVKVGERPDRAPR